ncbi:MAG: LytR C-terminal domain-containing protein [Longimicrobiales bacterium]
MAARAETIGLGVLLAFIAAFVVSFVRGVGTGVEDEIPDEPPAPRLTTPEPSGIARGTLEVLNAAGTTGLARRATRQLRDAGFDVVYYGNAPAETDDSSVVIDRVGAPEIARAAAASLGIARVRSEPDSGLFIDATVIVGVDWPRAK